MLAAGSLIHSGEGREIIIDEPPAQWTLLHGIGWGEVGGSPVTKSAFRFGQFNGELIYITLGGGREIALTPDHFVFAKFAPDSVFNYVYLTQRIGKGFRLDQGHGLVKDSRNNNLIFRRDPSIDEPFEERVWLLESSPHPLDAELLKQILSLKFTIPTHPFTNRVNKTHLQTRHLEKLYSEIDTRPGSERLLDHYHMFRKYPHFTVKFRGQKDFTSQTVILTIFGGQNKKDHPHFPHLITVNNVQNPNFKKGFATFAKKNPSDFWDIEVEREDLEEARIFVKTLTNLEDALNYTTRIQLGKNTPYYLIPASHLKEGMFVPLLGPHAIQEAEVQKVKNEDYRGFVYNITSPMQNIVVNGVFVSDFSCLTDNES